MEYWLEIGEGNEKYGDTNLAYSYKNSTLNISATISRAIIKSEHDAENTTWLIN
jgi:hypothetical protein